jgi:large subunit ribosomal protein L10
MESIMRPEKQAIADELKERLGGSSFVILAGYQGLTVAQSERLRGELAKTDARMMVVPNRQFGYVARSLDLGGLAEGAFGPTAMIFGRGDAVEASKVLRGFARETSLPVVRLGALDGRMLSAADVAQLADLPPREVMLAIVVGTIAAPMTRLVGVMNQKLRSLLYVLMAARDQKASE